MSHVIGNFKKYIFHSDNGYTVGLFHVKESNILACPKSITFTGFFPELDEVTSYKLKGEFITHEKYGTQFNVTSYEAILPNDEDNIIAFLSSELFKGIGEAKAKKIVDVLGNKCLNIILENKESLNEVESLNEKQRELIYNKLLEYNTSYERMLYLTKLGFSVKNAVKIEKFYQSDLSHIIKNPYYIIDDIKEITFPIIDKVRKNLDVALDDIKRVAYGIVYYLEYLSFKTGNIYFSYDEISNATSKGLSVNKNVINEGIAYLVTEGKILIDDDKYILTDYYDKSIYIAKRILDLSLKNNNKKYEKDLSLLENETGCIFNNKQKDAITNALNYNFSVITGGPGTGKTTIIKAITTLYKKINKLSSEELTKALILLASTGRASKRMSEKTNLPSYTIHRFLKWQKENNTFMINEENKSNAKIVIIDESSMIDEDLLYNLLKGLKTSCKIVMIGDYNQLPSVGAGQILKDIIESNSVKVTSLEKLYRQDENSNINFFAHDIIKGICSFDLFNISDDLTFIPATEENLKEKLYDFIETYKDEVYETQILAPMYKGENGIINLNNYCQKVLNNNSLKNQITHNDVSFKEEDKVINLVNNLDDNIFNGDIGEILSITSGKKKEIICDFDGNITKYDSSNFDNISLGYVISIHKAQGSEFDTIIIPILKSYNYMLYRKLIYTAVTRAKKRLIILGNEEGVKKAIITNRDDNRKTVLKNFLSEGINL